MEFYTEQTKREAEEYGSSNLQGAVERMSDDRWAALIQENNSNANSQHRPAPPRPAPPPPSIGTQRKNTNGDLNDMMDELAIRTVSFLVVVVQDFHFNWIINNTPIFVKISQNHLNHQWILVIIHLLTVFLLLP